MKTSFEIDGWGSGWGSICSTMSSCRQPLQHTLQLHQRPRAAPRGRYLKTVQLLNHLPLREPLRLERRAR